MGNAGRSAWLLSGRTRPSPEDLRTERQAFGSEKRSDGRNQREQEKEVGVGGKSVYPELP